MATTRADGGGKADPYADLLGFLRSKLRGLYFSSSGTPSRDVAYVNLLRLRALFEDVGRENILIDVKSRNSIHDYLKGIKDDRLQNAAANIFGLPGTPHWRQNVSGEIGEGDGRGPARAQVDRQKQLMTNHAAQTDDLPIGWAGTGTTTSTPAPEQSTPATGGRDGQPAAMDSTQAAAERDARHGRQPAPVEAATGDEIAPVGGGGAGGAGGAGGGAGGGVDSGLSPAGTPRQVPGGGELWWVDGRDYYLAYTIPGTRTPLLWRIENPERLEAIFGTALPEVDRELSGKELRRMSPWQMGGLAAELVNTDENPWEQFLSDYEKAAELRPWLRDPSTLAVISVAYLEGRDPTADELATTDWWNNHTADERAWMEDSATLGREEVERRRDDAARGVMEALRQAGMSNPSKVLADYIARQRLTGRWSETYTSEQVRKITDPFAPGTLDRGLLGALRDPEMSDPADARALSEGREAVIDRVRAMFRNARVDIESGDERASVRLDRIASEIMAGKRSFSDVRHSIDLLAAKTPGGRPGGFDTNVKGEDRVRALMADWVGPSVAAGYDDKWVAEWAGRLRNDPDAEQELVTLLQGARVAAFGNWKDPNVRYADIAPVARSLFSRVWGQTPDETDPLFLDIVNMRDQAEAASKLRKEGLSRGVAPVVDSALEGLSSTAVGQQVIRSAV